MTEIQAQVDPTEQTNEMNQYVQSLLKQMQDKFDEMSNNLVGKIDDMGQQIDDIEKNLNDMMNAIDLEDGDFTSDEEIQN